MSAEKFQVICPNCQKAHSVGQEFIGRVANCNACNTSFELRLKKKTKDSERTKQKGKKLGSLRSNIATEQQAKQQTRKRRPQGRPRDQESKASMYLVIAFGLLLLVAGAAYLLSSRDTESEPKGEALSEINQETREPITASDGDRSSRLGQEPECQASDYQPSEQQPLSTSVDHVIRDARDTSKPEHSLAKSPSAYSTEKSAILKLDIWAPAGAYDESSEAGIDTLKAKGSYWLKYTDFDFGEGATYFEIEMMSLAEVDFEIRLGSPEGTTIASYALDKSKKWILQQGPLSQKIQGIQDLYFVFERKKGMYYGVRDFIFRSVGPGLKQPLSKFNTRDFDRESHPGKAPIQAGKTTLEGIKDASWVAFSNFDFGTKSNHIAVEAASPFSGGRIEVILDSLESKPIALIDVQHTGSRTLFFQYKAHFASSVAGKHTLYLKFVDSFNNPEMFITRNLIVSYKAPIVRDQLHRKGQLHVYHSVPELPPSPYYSFSIQKVSKLDNNNPSQASNWEKPFAWFTKCRTDLGKAYFDGAVGDWSATYCNFELGPETPVVIKIKRLNKKGAPSGPIKSVSARPVRHIKSCEIINGDVYITMDKPALLVVDIDGQMDSRDAPRNLQSRKGRADATPFDNEMEGVHSITIFANPFIDD
ncbi:MAG: carbohydrate-binding protein, partial [Planctomycetes bacterium]|nr:carbohydrate-binding protein [Planctomycetota bacterium]